MPVDDRARNPVDQAADKTAGPEAEAEDQEERKERSGAQIAAAGVAGAAVVGTGAGAVVAGSGMVADRLTSDGDVDVAEAVAEPAASLDVFDDVETAEDASAGAQPSGERITTVSQPLAPTPAEVPIAQPEQVSEDPRRSTARTDAPAPSPAPSSVADTTVIAATEAGTTGVSGLESTVPTAPLINRPADDPAPPVVEDVDIPEVPETSAGAGFVPDPSQINVPVIEDPVSEPAVELDEEGSGSSEQETSSASDGESSSSDDITDDDGQPDQVESSEYETDAPDDDPAPVHHDEPDHGTMPPHEQVEDDYHQDVAPPHYDDVVEDEVDQDYDDYYYAPFPGNKGYQHPQDLYGDPELVSGGQGGDVYLYKDDEGRDYATIIRDVYGNETITWWYGDPQDAYVVYQVRVTHDGYGDYTEQIMSYPVGEVDLLLGNIYVNDAQRQDPDLLYGKDNAAETIEPHVIIRTWTDDDGNMVMKRIHRDGSGKIEISYGDGVYVVYEGGEYTYFQDGELVNGDDLDAVDEPGMDPDEDYTGNGLHPLSGGPGYFIEEQFENPLTAGLEAMGPDEHLQYIDPETGARMFVTELGTGEYLVGWQTDPNAPPGEFELVVKVQVDAEGHYAGFNTTYYTGDVPVVDTIPNLGYTSVNGEMYLDPSQEYGFPAENASQVVTEDTVVQTWETDEGTITKTYHRDGSHKTVTEHADGVIVTYDPDVNPYPTYEVPEDAAPEPYVGEPGAYLPPTAPDEFEINGETYPNPEQDDSYTYLKTEGPFGTPDGTVTNHHYVDENGYLVIIGVHSDGQYEVMYGDPNTPLAGWDMRVVMQPDGSYSALPGYLDEGPTDDSGEEPDISAEPRTYYSADYVHPEDQYSDGPTQTAVSGGVQVDTYPDATVYTREDGSQVIVWMAVDENGNPEMVEAPIPTDGAPDLVGDTGPDNVQAWDMVVEVDAGGGVHITTLPPEAWRVIPGDLDDGGAYLDPDTSGMSYEQAYRGINASASVVRVYEDGTVKTMSRDDGTLFIEYPDGAAFQVDAAGTVTLLQAAEDVPQEDDSVESDASDDQNDMEDSPETELDTSDEPVDDAFEPWTAHLPEYFWIENVGHLNPEAYLGGEDNGFTLASESDGVRVYSNTGYQVRITEQPGGSYSFEWRNDGDDGPYLAIDVYADGSHQVMYNAIESYETENVATGNGSSDGEVGEMTGALSFEAEETLDNEVPENQEPDDNMFASTNANNAEPEEEEPLAETEFQDESLPEEDASLVGAPEEEPIGTSMDMPEDLDDSDDDEDESPGL